MALLTIQQAFGVNVVETSTTITIQKSDLIGLTPNPNNTANSLFAGIINTVHKQYEGRLAAPSGDDVTSNNGDVITFDNTHHYSSTWVKFYAYYLPKGKLNTCFLYSQISPYAN